MLGPGTTSSSLHLNLCSSPRVLICNTYLVSCWENEGVSTCMNSAPMSTWHGVSAQRSLTVITVLSLPHTLVPHMTPHTKHLLSVSLLNPTLWNDRKGPLTPCPEVPWSLYLGLLGDFALWTYLREFPPWLLCPQWNDSLVIQPPQMTRVRVCWQEELLAGCAPRRSCGGSSCFAGDKGSQGLPHLPA